MTHPAIHSEIIEKKIFLIRQQKVMLEFHLAELYGVEVKALKRTVRRNIDRFPEDFMFEINRDEYNSLRYHFGTLKRGKHTKYLPFAFTELGVAMLSSVLRSKRAIHVNIEIMRAFVKLRKLLASHKDLERKLNELESGYDSKFKIVFDALRELMKPPERTKRPLGFRVGEKRAVYKAKK
jgi:hypothetical protein